jgi:hypothetical protein
MSRDYWEHRYQTKDMSWDKGEPSPGLVDFLATHPDLPRGSVAVPGCGSGNDVRAFAAAGFEAFGFDLAPSAIRLAIEKTAAAAADLGAPVSCRQNASGGENVGRMPALPGGPEAKFAQADFLRDEPPQKFDWVFEHTLFCAIQPLERDAYVQAVLQWLKPGGNYLAVNYFLCEPNGPPWPTTREELGERFSPHFELLAEWTPRSYPNRTDKERMFWWCRKA